MEAEIAGGRQEGARTRYFEGIRALNKKQGFLKSTLHRFYGSLPDESTLEVGQCIMVRELFSSVVLYQRKISDDVGGGPSDILLPFG